MTRLAAITGPAVRVGPGFWSEVQDRLRRRALPYQWRVLGDEEPGVDHPSHGLRNLRLAAGEADASDRSEGYLGRYHTDTDLAKWLEATAYVLERADAPDLEAGAERIVALAAKSQAADGHLSSRARLDPARGSWGSLRRDHELYVAGHWLEALVAYDRARRSALAMATAVRLGDHLVATFGPHSPNPHAYPDHPEVELALARLWRATGRAAYLDLARHFVDERGRPPHLFSAEAKRDRQPWRYDETYSLSDRPLREHLSAQGHAVRAMYLYAGAADIAAARSDQALQDTLRRLWQDVVERQMYVTGAVGTDGHGERFTIAYDLPNDRAYAETCASVGLVLWARRMLAMDGDARYADVLERALYNGVLSGLSLDGERYFYVNPLEVWPAQAKVRHDLVDVATVRAPWFECACCPPNVARLLASMPDDLYAVGESGRELYVSQYAASDVGATLAGGDEVQVGQAGDYPWSGDVHLRVGHAPGARWTLCLRRPGWARSAEVWVNGERVAAAPLRDGYLRIARRWQAGDSVHLRLDMPVERLRADPRAWGLGGMVALQRGPVVYCLEEADNGPGLAAVSVPGDGEWVARPGPGALGGVSVLSGRAFRRLPTAGGLYCPDPPAAEATTATAVPYAVWGNRGEGEMRVWLPEA